jgi:hypothetical protein
LQLFDKENAKTGPIGFLEDLQAFVMSRTGQMMSIDVKNKKTLLDMGKIVNPLSTGAGRHKYPSNLYLC